MSLLEMQTRLRSPKAQKNEFGGFMYRSIEDIMEAVKPLLVEFNYTLHFDETILMIGDRFYVQNIVTLKDKDGKEIGRAVGHAREETTKKGMDASMITGSASSYSAKYACGKLFLISNEKDADTLDNREPEQKAAPKKATPKNNIDLKDLKTHVDAAESVKDLEDLMTTYKIQINSAGKKEKAVALFSARKIEIMEGK